MKPVDADPGVPMEREEEDPGFLGGRDGTGAGPPHAHIRY